MIFGLFFKRILGFLLCGIGGYGVEISLAVEFWLGWYLITEQADLKRVVLSLSLPPEYSNSGCVHYPGRR